MEPFNPSLPGVLSDPYRQYLVYRQKDPVHCSQAATDEKPGYWYLFHYADVQQTLRDARFGREEPYPKPRKSDKPEPFYEMAGKWMLYRDPPDQTRLHALVARAFTPAMVFALRPRIAELANGLLDAVHGRGAMDVIADYAFPLPLTIIANLLGVRAEDRAQFRVWSNALQAALDQNRTPEVYTQANAATLALEDYFGEIIAERRVCPQDDLVSRLLAAEEQGGHLTESEVVATCILLLGAGQGTTVDLIGNSLVALLKHPEQLAHLMAHPETMPAALEELLRYDSPVQMTARIALQDVELGGKLIKRNDRVTLVLGAANHDPLVFPEPEVLDLRRPPKTHMGFGLGIHFCLGAVLARAGAQIALTTLLDRYPHVNLIEEPHPPTQVVFRGYEHIKVSLGAEHCCTTKNLLARASPMCEHALTPGLLAVAS